MTSVSVVRFPGDAGFVAVVFVGDRDEPRRIWVCAYNTRLSANRSWLGSWCRNDVEDPEEVRRFLRELSGEIEAKSSIGPLGPWLGDIYFFDGWETWDGIPAPLMELPPAASFMDPAGFITIADWRPDDETLAEQQSW